LSLFFLDSAGDTGRVVLSSRSHGGDDNDPYVPIHFIRGNNEAGPGFLNLGTDGRIKICQEDIEPDVNIRKAYRHWQNTRRAIKSKNTPLNDADLFFPQWLDPVNVLACDF
jgi:hypothetical protein